MAEQRIRDLVIDKLAEHIGVLGGVIVDELIAELGLGPAGLNDRRALTRFLARLKKELPEDLDVHQIVEEIRVAIHLRLAA